MNQPDEHVAVEHLLPYRSSTLLVTDTVSCDPEHGITCRLDLLGDEHYFQGHFPKAPMFPGVLELEAMFQSACLWYALKTHANDSSRRKPTPGLVLSGIRSARFQHSIIPPQSVEISVRVETRTDKNILFSGSIADRNDENPRTFARASFHTTVIG
jgi:3-hydroxyacyl-[acyl-carrier-protein] dehydratase